MRVQLTFYSFSPGPWPNSTSSLPRGVHLQEVPRQAGHRGHVPVMEVTFE